MWSLTQCAQESGTAVLYGSQFKCIFHLWPFPVGCDTKHITLLRMSLLSKESIF